MKKTIRIGTRDSQLAAWQARQVLNYCNGLSVQAALTFIKTEGDMNLHTPLYELGVQGIFTKALDLALLNGEIDMAVHSFKDVPTQLAAGLQVAAVLERGNPYDVLLCREQWLARDLRAALRTDELYSMFIHRYPGLTVATGSIRRKAQWLRRFPDSVVEEIRGNIQSRIRKFRESRWQGAIFAMAGLERLGFMENETGTSLVLDWMVPAPAQGAIAVVCRKNDTGIIKELEGLNDKKTQLCTTVEREFMQRLQGGCTTPVGALAVITGNEMELTASITLPDGSEDITVKLKTGLEDYGMLADQAAREMISMGGKYLLKS